MLYVHLKRECSTKLGMGYVKKRADVVRLQNVNGFR